MTMLMCFFFCVQAVYPLSLRLCSYDNVPNNSQTIIAASHFK